METTCVKALVTGKVQGVFYRAWTQETACDLGLRGWVRNCADGSVEAHVEGEEPTVLKLVERMRFGPREANVDDVQIESAEPEDSTGFQVRF